MKKRIAITGASGFVGKRYLTYSKDLYDISTFSVTNDIPSIHELSSIQTIVHLGGLAHQMIPVPPERYFVANFDNTKQLAEAAKAAGVSHFIFISTIKVFGELQKTVLTENSPCLPENDPYGESKLKAEQYLHTLADDNFTVTIIRPPLIYGPGVKGNLAKLLKLCDSNYPLPFGSLDNRRTMIYLDNFIALINHVIDKKAGGLLLAGDERPITTEEMVSKMRMYLGRQPRLFPVPSFARTLITKLKPALGKRLFGALEMDTVTSYKKINFIPPHPIDEGIKVMVEAYLHNKTGNLND